MVILGHRCRAGRRGDPYRHTPRRAARRAAERRAANDGGPGSPPSRQLSAGLLNDRGVCLLALGHPRGALEAFTDCLAIEPGHAAARANLATARGRLGGSDHQGGPSID